MTHTKTYRSVIAASFALAVTVNAQAGNDNPCRYANGRQACATVPLATEAQDAAAKQFLPPAPGRAVLYIVRDSIGVQRQTVKILLNGQAAAEIAPYTYTAIDLAPGAYRIDTRDADRNAHVSLEAEAGQRYFVDTSLSLLFTTVRSHLHLLHYQEGQAKILQSQKIRANADTE